MGNKRPLEPVAFDIETEGLLMSDEITVAGLRLPMGGLVIVNTGGRPVPDVSELEQRVQHQSELEHVKIVMVSEERELLARLREEIKAKVWNKNRMLVAYNGETWRGGFDLPVVRTRCVHTGEEWPFNDVPYADLMDIVHKRLHTMVEGEDGPTSVGDLCGVYDELIGGTHCDPWADSAEAIKAAYNADWEPLILHNIADIERTQQLAELAQKLVPVKDFHLKNLGTPHAGRW